LISTDVAARGIHIKRLKYVVNYDFPPNIEQYCHRIGRCGRQGDEGESYSLLTRSFAAMAEDLVELLKTCEQAPEPNLERLAVQFSMGEVEPDDDADAGADDDEELTQETGHEEVQK
jgi:ATP-dependent RNA helicase DDX5/DBP2